MDEDKHAEFACALALTNLHGLRATGSSIALAAGIPHAVVEAQLGHSGSGILERHYRDVVSAPERFGVR